MAGCFHGVSIEDLPSVNAYSALLANGNVSPGLHSSTDEQSRGVLFKNPVLLANQSGTMFTLEGFNVGFRGLSFSLKTPVRGWPVP